jgi:hypothetical protein
MFETKMETKINEAVEATVSEERLVELKDKTVELVQTKIDGLSFADVVVMRNFISDALTNYIVDDALAAGVITEEDIDTATNDNSIEELMALIQKEIDEEDEENEVYKDSDGDA